MRKNYFFHVSEREREKFSWMEEKSIKFSLFRSQFRTFSFSQIVPKCSWCKRKLSDFSINFPLMKIFLSHDLLSPSVFLLLFVLDVVAETINSIPNHFLRILFLKDEFKSSIEWKENFTLDSTSGASIQYKFHWAVWQKRNIWATAAEIWEKNTTRRREKEINSNFIFLLTL
jgi:hypothetical protein